MYKQTLSCLLSVAILLVSSPVFAAPAFPGAAGWGKTATGGGQREDTKILFVTSLEDSGAGTLREAIAVKGPRIIVFKTGGIIPLKSTLSLTQGNVTIAGQTAPGDGIILQNYPLKIRAKNVIVRGLRIRNGDGPGPRGELRDSLQFGSESQGPADTVMVDHCSFGWSMDEICDFWYGARNTTLSYCIFSEALWQSQHEKGMHGYGMLLGNGKSERITFHHNLFAHNERRNPWIKDNATVEVVNNVVYNWGNEGLGLWRDGEAPAIQVNVVGNFFKPGVNTKKGQKGINMGKIPAPGSQLFFQGNVGPGREGDMGDEKNAIGVGAYEPKPFFSNKSLTEIASGLPAEPAKEAFERVLQHVGAVPRDAADKRAVTDTRTGTGKKVDKLAEVGGYPAYSAGTYPMDTDKDGMPDVWEKANGLNPADAGDAVRFQRDGKGYVNIEVYVNSLIPDPVAPESADLSAK